MTAADRPWWSSPDDGLDADADLDPVESHRRARRGAAATPDGAETAADRRPDDDGSWWFPATEAVTRLARELGASAAADARHGTRSGAPRADARDGDVGDPGADPGEGRGAGGSPGDGDGTDGGAGGGAHRIDACGICPICVGLRALGDARPDLVAHLAEAARHLALAVRTVVDAATEPGEAADPAAAPRTARRRPRHDDLQHIDLDDG